MTTIQSWIQKNIQKDNALHFWSSKINSVLYFFTKKMWDYLNASKDNYSLIGSNVCDTSSKYQENIN